MRAKPIALVCMNDEIALGVMHALKQAGVQIPDEISVCGTDNLKISGFSNPPLTTVDIDKVKMGEAAAKLLIGLIAGEGCMEDERIVEIPTKLIIRDSAAVCGLNGSPSLERKRV